MTQTFHFISGLPRSGSTLLAAILKQNPRFHAGMSSPVGALFSSTLANVSAGSEFSVMVSKEQRRNLLRGVFNNFYQDLDSQKEVIFDTSRLWCSKMPALMELFPQSKVIACVRNVAWIMDSMERKFRENPFENTRLFNDDVERNTVYSRVDTLGQRNRMVGFAWSALKEAFYSEQAGSLLVIDYDLLSSAPEKVLPLVYQFLGEPYFEHDFNNVEYDAPDFDAALGVEGLHRVRPKITFQPRATLLPPDLFSNYSDMSFWLNQEGSRANVITVTPTKI